MWKTTSNIKYINISKLIIIKTIKDIFIEINNYFNTEKYNKKVITPNINEDLYIYSKFVTINVNIVIYR